MYSPKYRPYKTTCSSQFTVSLKLPIEAHRHEVIDCRCPLQFPPPAQCKSISPDRCLLSQRAKGQEIIP